jgi:hypothetical protein
MNRFNVALTVLLPALLLAALASLAAAQETGTLPQSALPSQSLRPYWHVFIAYSLVIVLVLGWVISIGRRLRDVEERLGQG